MLANRGKSIKGLYINDSKTQLVFEFADGTFGMLETEGDCCSSSWMEHIQGVKQVLGRNLLGGGAVGFPDGYQLVEAPEDKYDVVQYYGFEVLTDFGKLFIEYRNSSNGYYGGYMEARDCSRVPAGFEPLTEDF